MKKGNQMANVEYYAKIEFTNREIQMLNDSIDVKRAALKRASNTEKDVDIKQLRVKAEQELATLQAKINTPSLWEKQNETNVSQQKK